MPLPTAKNKKHPKSVKQAITDSQTINHPAHYGSDTTYEVIKVIEAWQLGFHLGNVVKYISRAGKKPGAGEVEDLRKAQWYLQRKILELTTE